MFVVIGEMEIPGMVTVPVEIGRAVLERKKPKRAMSLGGAAIVKLLDPMVFKFSQVRGKWVKVGETMVLAAGNPPSDEEMKMAVREMVRKG